MRKKQELVHTPEGVRDSYGPEYQLQLTVTDSIRRTMKSYGFEDLKTPTFEFFDVFSSQIGTTPSRELYKFFDKEGNTLVLRPDFTPSVARCTAKYYAEESRPIRFCYQGSAFSNTSDLQGKLKESTQAGAELMNDPSVYADAEMIALLTECLQAAGLSRFQITVGNVEYFRGLCEAAGIGEETEEELREYISGKNYFAAEDLLRSEEIAPEYRELFLQITNYRKNDAELQEVLDRTKNPGARRALERLISLHLLLKEYGVEKFVSYDLSLLSKYHYYTGVIFKGYTYGVGEAIASGGRYDRLLSHFGKDAAAIGFMIPVDILLEAMKRQNLLPADLQQSDIVRLTYREDNYAEVLGKARALRAQGRCAVMIRETEQDAASGSAAEEGGV
ncbi:MAG: ATP phosphoribosyltransferase regulatory subunit [Lachnospiraceae bacterium]|nr:ATP phosphoribosyltransferase regulatory subunit [Lachnospiraceae bacterium]